jgi:hypothetical protein
LKAWRRAQDQSSWGAKVVRVEKKISTQITYQKYVGQAGIAQSNRTFVYSSKRLAFYGFMQTAGRRRNLVFGTQLHTYDMKGAQMLVKLVLSVQLACKSHCKQDSHLTTATL